MNKIKNSALISLILIMIFSFYSNVSAKNSAAFSLQILHSSDNESAFQNPDSLEPEILHYGAVLSGLRQLAAKEGIPSIYLTAGDHTITGPFYKAAAEVEYLGAPGLGDIAVFNAMGLSANCMGNHEFDGGINDFARMLNHARYPFIAVNLDFSKVKTSEGIPPVRIGKDGQNAAENAGKVVKSAWVKAGEERIGLIGRAPADFFNVIANPEKTLPGLDFTGGRNPENNQPLVSAADQVLEQVSLLESQGINKIILLDHAQDYTADPLAAKSLRGIDIIITAGSTGFMAKTKADGPFNMLRKGDRPNGVYPAVLKDSKGYNILVVNSDQQYRYAGNLIARFDKAGHIINADPRSGPVPSNLQAVAGLEKIIGHPLSAPSEAVKIFNDLKNTPLIQEQFRIIGTTAGLLNGERADARTRETNLGRLVTDSTLWYVKQAFPELNVKFVLKNGGGIRDSIPGPNITKMSVAAALPFNNSLSVIELRADELLAVMENAVSRIPHKDGRFPHIAGIFLEYDSQKPGVSGKISLTIPSRIKTLGILCGDKTSDIIVRDFKIQGDISRKFRMVTNRFLLSGGDGYQALKFEAEKFVVRHLDLKEREILILYIQKALEGKVEVLEPLENLRVKNIFYRDRPQPKSN